MNNKFKLAIILLFFSLYFCLNAVENPQEPEGLSFINAGNMAVSSSLELINRYKQFYLHKEAYSWGIRSYFPQITFGISEDDRLSVVSSDSFIKNYSVGAEQLIWDGGRISRYREIEKAEMEIEYLNLNRSSMDLSEEAISFYRQVIFYRKLKSIRENALVSLEEQKQIMLREAELGIVLPVSLAEADITISETKIELISLTLDLEEAEVKFAEILGVDILPPLLDELYFDRQFNILNSDDAKNLAQTRNLEIKAAELALDKRKAEVKFASQSWLPVIKLTGNIGLSGYHYPLTKYNWTVGLTFEFSTPWVSAKFAGTTGREPPNESSAKAQNSTSVLPNPAESYSAKNLKLLLELEEESFDLSVIRIGRLAVQTVEKCVLLEEKRALAIESLNLEKEKYRLLELKLDLGMITRIEIMEARLEYAAKEASVLDATMQLLETERELEKILNLGPGELHNFRGVI